MTKIFMAEDDPFLCRMYQRSFSASDYDLEVGIDGEDALLKLEQMVDAPPALIMLDIIMPKKSGLTLLAEIKQNEKLKNIPVIMLTNQSDASDQKTSFNLGAVLYLVKSQYGPQQIVDMAKEVIANAKNGTHTPILNNF